MVKGRKKALSLQEELEVCKRYRAGEKVLGIQLELNVSGPTIYRTLDAHDIPLRRPRSGRGG